MLKKLQTVKKTIPFFLSCLAVILFILQIQACGRKDWPAPAASEDRFAFQKVNATKQGNCLKIQAKLSGNVDNLESITLELQSAASRCEDCPFQPDKTINIKRGSSRIFLKGFRLNISYCKLKEETSYRWRIKGINIYPQLPAVASKLSWIKAD